MYVNKPYKCVSCKQGNARIGLVYNDSSRLGGAHLLATKEINMPALSIIPFILYLMDPLPQNFQQLEGFASPLTMETDIKTSNSLASSTLTFTKNLGGPGKLPGKHFYPKRLTVYY